MRGALLVALAACSSKSSPPPPVEPPAPVIDRAALLAGKLPDGPEADLINAQCRICHSVDYLTQQRLSEAAWRKTIEKMKNFGASLDDTQVGSLASFAARHWNPELPARTWTVVEPPPGALPD